MAKSDFPALMWHPKTAECRVFNAAEDVPQGWLSYSPNDAEKAAADVPAPPPPLSRAEVMAELKRRGVTFRASLTTEQLYEVLLETDEKEV